MIRERTLRRKTQKEKPRGSSRSGISECRRASGANVWKYQPNGSAAQSWTIMQDEEGRFTIISTLGTALDVAGGTARQGTNVWAYAPNGSAAQMWTLNLSSINIAVELKQH